MMTKTANVRKCLILKVYIVLPLWEVDLCLPSCLRRGCIACWPKRFVWFRRQRGQNSSVPEVLRVEESAVPQLVPLLQWISAAFSSERCVWDPPSPKPRHVQRLSERSQNHPIFANKLQTNNETL